MANINRTIEQITSDIRDLDLDPIKFKLMDKQEGYGWTREQADQHELEYRRFLTLLVKYPGELIAPSKAVDKFWHGHILDTMKYAEDCERVFGYFLHHFPYFGMRGEEDAANLAAAAVNMKRLYAQEFGVREQAEPSFCGAAAEASFCGAAAEASFCGAAEASFCGAAQVSQSDISLDKTLLNISSRPALPSA
ncbi:MAG TPA: hypothetical protein VF427_13055 [Noviherbaspirillum sp.]